MTKPAYSKKDLFQSPAIPVYRDRQLDEIAFPLGGIGTGCISLGGWGRIRDWEIFNSPNKGFAPNICFFALHAREEGKDPVSRILRGPQQGSYSGNGHGWFDFAAGLPCMKNNTFTAGFPVARIDFSDEALPLSARLEAFNPFIPLDEKNSSIPAAIFLFHLRNTQEKTVSVKLLSALENLCGTAQAAEGQNTVFNGRHASGISFSNPSVSADSPHFISIAMGSPWPGQNQTTNIFHDPDNQPGKAAMTSWKFWKEFEGNGTTALNRDKTRAEKPAGGLLLETSISSGQTVTLPLIITWYNPVSCAGAACCGGDGPCAQGWKTYVSSCFTCAEEVLEYTAEHLPELEEKTRRFHDCFYASTIPGCLLEAAGSQISILKSTTCLRFENGDFWGWEGVSNTAGCCAGTCTHVWNYAQALPFLYPSLARSIHNQQFALSTGENGKMCFRQPLPPGSRGDIEGFHACTDGQLGTVMRVYREWLVSGNDAWLREIWPQCKKALEYTWLYWDADKDGVIEGVQHNTYDNEFWGANSMTGTMYLGALRAAEEMSRYVGDKESAEEYRRVFESGRKKTEKLLFNGKWYEQKINPEANRHTDFESGHLADGEKIPRAQFGKGCLSDQLIGQWYAELLGLGRLLKPARIKKTLKSIFKYNWKTDMHEHACFYRSYAFPGERGLVLCSWPEGGEPPYPFWFASEVWSGIEYQVAGHMIYEGMVEEGLSIVKGVRDRYSGVRRNPWDEFECGHHYSRSMASYALLNAIGGFYYSAPEQTMGIDPKIKEKNFKLFFSVESGWGLIKRKLKKDSLTVEVEPARGSLSLSRFILPAGPYEAGTARLAGRKISHSLNKTDDRMIIELEEPAVITEGNTLAVTLRREKQYRRSVKARAEH